MHVGPSAVIVISTVDRSNDFNASPMIHVQVIARARHLDEIAWTFIGKTTAQKPIQSDPAKTFHRNSNCKTFHKHGQLTEDLCSLNTDVPLVGTDRYLFNATWSR